MNNLITLLSAPWAIEPAKLVEIRAIYGARLQGQKADIEAVEARLGRPLQNQSTVAYTVQDGVAVLPIEGIIAKRMNMLTQISGGTSSQLAAQALQTAIKDPGVHSIILSIDSPGGTVDGTQALADVVFAARSSGKPIVALADGAMCSAAYWVGSAAQAAYIADSTTQVGSIGVVTSHTDISGAQAAQGVKTTEISAGKYKRIASQYTALSPDGRQSLQDSIDYTYSLFVDAVAKNRNVSSKTVLSKMADGRVFMGQQAVDAGLVDGIETLDSLVSRLNTNRKTGATLKQVKVVPQIRAELDQATKAHMKAHPGIDYVTAFKVVTGDTGQRVIGEQMVEGGAQPVRVASQSRAAIDEAAKAYVKAHPGMTYVAAVKRVTQEGPVNAA